MKLHHYLSRAGVDSRRKCEAIILAGRVKVNGEVLTALGTKVDEGDLVELDGKPVAPAFEPIVYMLNKPKGVVSTCSDPQGRPTVLDFFKDVQGRLFPVGRLDFDTTGLLLITNDGDLAQRLMHPSFEVSKTYVATVKGIVQKSHLRKLEHGVDLGEYRTGRAKAELVSQRGQAGVIRITIREGKNREVRRMLAAVGLPATELHRERLGNLTLGGLKPGQRRRLRTRERELMEQKLK